MGKKMILCGVICLASVCAAGCQKSDSYRLMEESKDKVLPIYEEDVLKAQDSALASLEDVYRQEYICEEWRCGAILRPGGILCWEDGIIITDRENDCVVKADGEGNVIKKVGKTGSGEGEFSAPGAIAGYQDKVYIIDQGNQRIQILDRELAYIGEVELKNKKEIDPDYLPEDLAVSEDGIYVAGLSLKDSGIDWYRDGKAKEAGENFIGSVFGRENEIYAVNSMVRYYDKENDSFGGATNAPEWLFAVKGEALEKVCELPYGFNITDFIIDEERLVCCSGAAGAVMVLGMDGRYEETAAYIQGLEDETYPQIKKGAQGEYYIVLPKAGKIFRCVKKQ